MLFVVLEARVTGSEASVRDMGINSIFLQILQRLLILVAAVDGDLDRGHHVRVIGVEMDADAFDGRLKQAVFLALSVGVRLYDDLVFGIDRHHTGVALDDTMAGFHLGAVVVGDVAFDDISAHAFSVFVGLEELADLLAGAVEFFLLLDLAGRLIAIPLVRVGEAVFFKDVVDGGINFGLFLFQFVVGATPRALSNASCRYLGCLYCS